MPEGPEIRLAADEVGRALVGRPASAVKFAFERLRKFESRLSGRTVTRVETRGKAILTHFSNNWVIFSHNQLYGRWFVVEAGKQPQTGRQLRLAIHNRNYSALLYSASNIEVMHCRDLERHPFLRRLGPDILGQSPGIDSIVDRLQARELRHRQLAGLLLDQRFLAGLGNYLRAEILTAAGLHPALRPADCSARQLRRLAREILLITRRSYRTGGITNPPRLVERLKAEGHTGREAHRFNTYGRDGQACHFCGSIIEVVNGGGRKMYFCPACQPDPARLQG